MHNESNLGANVVYMHVTCGPCVMWCLCVCVRWPGEGGGDKKIFLITTFVMHYNPMHRIVSIVSTQPYNWRCLEYHSVSY